MLSLSCFGRAVTRAALFGRFVPPKTCYFPPNICSLRPVPHGARAGTTSAGAAPRVRDPERRAPGIGDSPQLGKYQVGRTGRKIIVVALPKRGQFENLPTPGGHSKSALPQKRTK